MVVCISKSIASWFQGIIIFLCLILVRLHLEYWCKSSWLEGNVHDVQGVAEGARFVQSEKQVVKGKVYHCLQIPKGGSERKQSQALRETQ